MTSDETTSPYPIITLDGGAASGKSSTARGVAKRLHFLHVDTGSHYRALTFLLLQAELTNEKEVADFLKKLVLDSKIKDHTAVLHADEKTPSYQDLRSDAVNRGVSFYSALPCVRKRLLSYQRWHAELAASAGFDGLVMEGRDIGSVVFPQAPYRFFLEADSTTRAKRRLSEGWIDSIQDRDRADSHRKNAPLICPTGALRIDTGTMTLEQVIDKISEIVKNGISSPSQYDPS